MEYRFNEACKAAAELMGRGYEVFSPIAHSHPIADHLDSELRTNFEFWMKQDLPVLKRCDALVVFALPGWYQSRGVTAEIAFARANGIPTYIIAGDTNLIHVLDQMIADDVDNYTQDTFEDFLDTEDASGDAVIASLNEKAAG